MSNTATVLEAIRDVRKRLQRLEEMLADPDDTEVPVSTAKVAVEIGVTPQALASWAQRHGAGSTRNGWRLRGRVGSGLRAHWEWLRLPLAVPDNGDTEAHHFNERPCQRSSWKGLPSKR
jgi:hypothetical protein